MSANQYTFVTVVYEKEYDLLLLQARSMGLYCDRGIAKKIIVIDNSIHPLSEGYKRRLLRAYGDISRIVEFLRPTDFANVPPSKGWTNQQILKLAISRTISTARYIVLDAKNHLVSPLTIEFLETPDGLPRTLPRIPYARTNPLRRDLERTLQYYGLEQEKYLASFTGATTPFILYTRIARELIEDVQQREGTSFEEAFLKYRPTEFFSYASFIITKGAEIESLYDLQLPQSPCIWAHNVSPKDCREVIAVASQKKSPFFAVHSRAISKLNSAARSEIVKLWVERSLFASTKSAHIFLLALQSKIIFYNLSKPIRHLPKSLRKRWNNLSATPSSKGLG